jgi:hypothetical protein
MLPRHLDFDPETLAFRLSHVVSDTKPYYLFEPLFRLSNVDKVLLR